MNTRLIALTCALAAAACADNKPAQDPTLSNMGEPPVATSPAATSHSDPGAPTTTTTSGTVTTSTTATTTSTPSASIDSSATTSSANVANNPGVADQTKNADNTKVNDRDRHGALTPMDQGSSGPEIKITAAIRKGLMGDKSLSFTAKNVKVITVGTKVTLRGPVKSDQEKASIEALAKQTTGVTDVDDQLEVKK